MANNTIQKIFEEGKIVKKAPTDLYIQPTKANLLKSLHCAPGSRKMLALWASKNEYLIRDVYNSLMGRPFGIKFNTAYDEGNELWYVLEVDVFTFAAQNARRIIADIDEQFSLALWDKEYNKEVTSK